MVGMVSQFDWQDGLTLVLAALCAGWVLWNTVRPFARRVADACGGCRSCETDETSNELLQIEPAEKP